MASVYVPPALEERFVSPEGDKDCLVKDAFDFSLDFVPNVYSWDEASKTFKFSFQEQGTAYGESTVSKCLVEKTFHCSGNTLNIKLQFKLLNDIQWGINFVGVITVSHPNGCQFDMFIPGTRTYDPAGKTGDPHASERIGPSCCLTQTAITLAQLMAAAEGVSLQSLVELQELLRPVILKYHGREMLFDWMFLQIKECVYLHRSVTAYPEFIKSRIAGNKLSLDDSRDHTKCYLLSYNQGSPRPPPQYYSKVAKKDNIDNLLSAEEVKKLKEIAGL